MIGLIVGACTGVVVATVVMLGRQTKAAARALAKLPVTPATALVAGTRVRVIGIVRATGGELITAHGGRRCVAYRAKVFVGGDPTTSRVCLGTTFALEADEVSIEIAEDPRLVVDTALDPVLDKPGTHVFGTGILAREAGITDGSTPTYSEGVIEAGTRVAVVGIVELRGDGTPRLVGTPAHPLVISNREAALVS